MEFAVGMAMQEEVFYSPREGGGEHAVALEAIREAGGAYVVFSPREGSQLEVVLATLPAVLDAFGNRIVPVPATSSGGERGGVTTSEALSLITLKGHHPSLIRAVNQGLSSVDKEALLTKWSLNASP